MLQILESTSQQVESMDPNNDLELDSIISTAWGPWTPPVGWWTPKFAAHGVRDSLIFMLNGSAGYNTVGRICTSSDTQCVNLAVLEAIESTE